MRYGPFGVSNIAWPASELGPALELLQDTDCTAVEIAPFNVFGRWSAIGDDARRLRETIEDRGLVCSALQGILFGVPDVKLFQDETSRERLVRHLEAVADLAGLLGAKACVFGAPKQRDPGDLAPAQAWDIAVTTLRRVGPAFAAHGAALAFEANARRYGCRFVTTTAEASRLVADVDTPGLGVQIDTGTLFLEQEPPDVLAEATRHAVHAHVSEPDLGPIGAEDHLAIAAALHASGYRGSLSIEMRPAEDWRAAVRSAVTFVRAAYS
jgi:sugar phosphate isomerase/epimerase